MWMIPCMWYIYLMCLCYEAESKYTEYPIDFDCAKIRRIDSKGGKISVGGDEVNYKKNLNCTVRIRPDNLLSSLAYPNAYPPKIGFKFIRFNIKDKWKWSELCEDYVAIYAGSMFEAPITLNGQNKGLCANALKDLPEDDYHYSLNSMDSFVRFVSDASIEDEGFDMSFTAYYPATGTICANPANEFLCANGHCISSEHRCNELDNCGDNSDEVSCNYDNATAFTSVVFTIIFVFCVRVICKEDRKKMLYEKKPNKKKKKSTTVNRKNHGL